VFDRCFRSRADDRAPGARHRVRVAAGRSRGAPGAGRDRPTLRRNRVIPDHMAVDADAAVGPQRCPDSGLAREMRFASKCPGAASRDMCETCGIRRQTGGFSVVAMLALLLSLSGVAVLAYWA